MKDFASVGNTTGAYPSVINKNCSGSGATDGTPLVSNTMNNYWGFFQMLLNRQGGSPTPSGVLEAYTVANAFSHTSPGQATIHLTTAQFLEAMQMQFGSPGELVLWSRSQAPATVGARILLLQGQTIAVASYPDLCNAVYCGDSVNNTTGVPFYLSSDSGGVTRATTGTYLTLPDARGVTIRGIDTDNTRDPLGSTRGGGTPNGSIELDALQGHYHSWLTNTGSITYAGSGASLSLSNTANVTPNAAIGSPLTDGTHGTPRTDSETRMINLACYIGIRY